MADSLKDKLNAGLLTVAGMMGETPQHNMLNMYMPLHPAAMRNGYMPDSAFSDRATGIAYKPVPSVLNCDF